MTATVIPLFRHEPDAREIWRRSEALAAFVRAEEATISMWCGRLSARYIGA